MTIRDHNREAWNKQVHQGNPWTAPVPPEVIAQAKLGHWKIYLTPCKPVPENWFPPFSGTKILCLASGGGQQGPILAAAGADVTVFDNSPRQLSQDEKVAERDGLSLDTVEGDMADLSVFPDETFDLVVHPVSNTFVPDIRPVWAEAFRVLKWGGYMLSGFDNPALHIFDQEAYRRGELVVANALPYSDAYTLSDEEKKERLESGVPLEFGHTLEDQIGGQTDVGFVILDFYEDVCRPEEDDLLNKYMSSFIATRSMKP